MTLKADMHRRLHEAIHSAAIEDLSLTEEERQLFEYFIENNVPERDQHDLIIRYLARQWRPPGLEAAE